MGKLSSAVEDSILNSVGEAIVALGSDERVTYANAAAGLITDQAPEDLLGRRYHDLVAHTGRSDHPDPDGSPCPGEGCFIQDAVKRGASRSERGVALLRTNGRRFPVECTTAPLRQGDRLVGAVVSLRSLGERTRAEDAVRQSEARLAEAQELADFGSWEWDVRQNTVTWSDQLFRMYGLTPQEFTPTYEGFLDLVHPDDLAMVTSAVERAFADGGSFSFDQRSVLPNGTVKIFAGRGQAVTNEDGEVVRLVGTSQDITERDAVARIKDEFISVVSHELRTPLTSIRASLGLLAGGVLGPLPEKGQRMLDIAIDNTERLRRLIEDILDIERIESGSVAIRMEAVATEELVEGARGAVQAMADDAGVTLFLASAGMPVCADRERIAQTLINLLSNAIKFSPRDSRVSVWVERSGDEVVLKVRDEGRGIPGDQLDSVFERFRQVDGSDARELGGTGLGLAICRTIVTQHGGRIWVESRVGEGSTFSFTLPAAPARHASEVELVAVGS